MCRKVMAFDQPTALSYDQIAMLNELRQTKAITSFDLYHRLPDCYYSCSGCVSRALNNLVRRGLVKKVGERHKAKFSLVVR